MNRQTAASARRRYRHSSAGDDREHGGLALSRRPGREVVAARVDAVLRHSPGPGEASPQDAKDLYEEGIEFHPLPVLPEERN